MMHIMIYILQKTFFKYAPEHVKCSGNLKVQGKYGKFIEALEMQVRRHIVLAVTWQHNTLNEFGVHSK